MGYATASTPTGDAGPTPFVKSASNPILKEANGVLGPGGGSIIRGPHGEDWLVYHARATDYTQRRTLRLDSVAWGSRGGVRSRANLQPALPRALEGAGVPRMGLSGTGRYGG